MTFIKKIYIDGFKSFGKPTEIIFDKGINVIVGPNGSGKSNIIDAICFVLGRSRAKSMRADKISNLIYNGGKTNKPANLACVKIVFDNHNKIFPIEKEEIEISRIVKRDGTSIYKINNETKTRQEVLELLSFGGIDPEGFNMILQSEIESFVRMHPEDKRKIIEEIAGISIYETRKEKALHELEKTEEKLREISTILKEREAFMRNLEKEKRQALRHEFLKKQIERCKLSLLLKKINEKENQIKKVVSIEKKQEEHLSKLADIIKSLDFQVKKNLSEIKKIEEKIEKEAGTTQEKILQEILELKTKITALELKKENIKEQLENASRKEENNTMEKERLMKEIKELEERSKLKIDISEKEKMELIKKEIERLEKELTELELKQKEIEVKRVEIDKKQMLIEEKESQKNFLIQEIRELEQEIKKEEQEKIEEKEIKIRKEEIRNNIDESKRKIKEIEKELTELLTKKEIHKKDVEEIFKLEQCPKCKQKITQEHKEKIAKEIWEIIKIIDSEIEKKTITKEEIELEIRKLAEQLENYLEKEKELISFYERRRFIEKKKEQLEKKKKELEKIEELLKKLKEEISFEKREISKINWIFKRKEECFIKIEKLKEDLLKLKLKYPFPLYVEKDIETEIMIKQREIEQCERNIRQARHEKVLLEVKLKEISKNLEEENKKLKEKIEEQKSFEKEFNELVLKKQKIQEKNHILELKINEYQINKNLVEQKINEIKIEKAKLEAEISALSQETKQFQNVDIIKASKKKIEKKLEKFEKELQQLGSVNLKAIEAYEKIKKEYDEIKEKLDKLEGEKQEILKIISEIDKKKRQVFMQTFNTINKYFSENYSMLSDKGTAFLELENKEDIFSGGVNIVIKVARGKYIESEALSGGEKVLVALSLIFAIQKYKPYYFYIFDEIDAALDKRNSEKLSNLIAQEKKSQYIIVTHNEVMINRADVLYGTSMQEGITKIVSLKL